MKPIRVEYPVGDSLFVLEENSKAWDVIEYEQGTSKQIHKFKTYVQAHSFIREQIRRVNES